MSIKSGPGRQIKLVYTSLVEVGKIKQTTLYQESFLKHIWSQTFPSCINVSLSFTVFGGKMTSISTVEQLRSSNLIVILGNGVLGTRE